MNIFKRIFKKFQKKEIDSEEIKMETLQIKHIPFPEFAIEGIDQSYLIKFLNFEIEDTLSLEDAERFIWPYWNKSNQENKIRTIISEKLDNWIFIYGYNHNPIEIIKKLIKHSNYRINYYSADSQTSDYEWIIANDGKIIREFYSCWNIEINKGEPLTELESKFVMSFSNKEFISGEDVCISIYNHTCGLDLKKYTAETKFKVGTITITLN